MGEGMLRFYRTKIKKEYKIAFVITFLITMLIHFYKIANTLPNHDSILNYYADQNVLASGRWALSLACGISSFYDLPWINGLLSCVFIALTVVVIVALFKLKNPVVIGLIGALLAASPATTETFFFLYTADGYMIAMFLAALAVYFSRMEETRFSRLLLSGVCICVSCGIYQAYVSFALLLAVCYFIDDLLQDNHSKQACLKWVLRQVIIYIVSLAVYYVIWKLCMQLGGIAANNYLGIAEVGKISFGLLARGLLNSIKATILYFLQWNILAHGLTPYNALNIVFLIAAAVGLLISCVKSGIFKRKWAFGLMLLCLIAIAPFASIWCFTSDLVIYRAIMHQSLILVFILIVLLYERWAKNIAKNAVCILMILITMNNALMANIGYFYLNISYERTYADGMEMVMRIRDFRKEFDFEKIAFVGSRVCEVKYDVFDPVTNEMQMIGNIYPFAGGIDKTMLFDSEHTTEFLKITFDLNGLDLDSLNMEQRNELLNTEEVMAMGCWPTDDSVAVIGDMLVIKLSDKPEEAVGITTGMSQQIT